MPPTQTLVSLAACARRVTLLGISRHMEMKQRPSRLHAGMLDVQQIFGRAGRPQYEDTGLGVPALLLALCSPYPDVARALLTRVGRGTQGSSSRSMRSSATTWAC